MAKKIVYSIEIDSTDAQGSIKRVEERLNELNQSANASQKEINTLQQELKELGQTNTNGAVQGVQSLRREYRRLIEELQQTEEGTEAFNRLAQEAGRVKDRIDAAQDSVNNFNKSPFENIIGNFRQLRQRIFDLDFDGFNQSLRDLRTNLGNVATSFIGIQKGAGLAVNGLKIFKVALAATGIGLLVVAITTLISNFDTLKESGGVIGNTFKAVGNIISSVTTSVLKLSDALGLTEKAYDKYIAKQKEGTEENKKETRSLEELRQAEFDLRKEKGLTTAAEEEANKRQNIRKKTTEEIIDLEKEAVKLQEDRNKLEQQLTEELNKTRVIGGGELIQTTTIKEFYATLNDEQKKNVDEQIKNYKKLQSEAPTFLSDDWLKKNDLQTGNDILNNIVDGLTGNVDTLTNQTDALVKDLVNVIDKENEINLIKNKQVETTERLTIVRKLQELELQKSIDETLQKDLDNAEKRKNRQLDALNRRFLQELETEESFNQKKEDIEQAFLSEKLRLNVKAGKDISAIQVQISDNLVKFEQQRLQDLKDFVDKAFSQTIEVNVAPSTIEERRPEDVKNANEKIGLLEKQVSVIRDLNGVLLEGGQLEIENLNQSIILNDAKLKVLEDYGLKDSELYRDAINEKILLETKLTKAINDENKKRLDDTKETSEKTKQENLQLASAVIQIASTLTNGIGNLVNMRYDNEIQRAGDNQEAIEKIQKEQFETNKALGIVTAIINTAQGITNALATSGPPWVGFAMAAVVGALGAAEVAMIAAQEFTPGTSGGSSFTPNAQLSQSMGSVSAMQPNVNFAAAGSGANIQTAGGGSAQSVQFTGSISVSEINNTQNLVNIYETGSLLGSG